MVQIVAFIVALVAVYALKAVAISRQHDELVQNSASLCWMRPRTYEEVVASAETTACELADAAHAAAPAPVSRPRVVPAA